ncbi:uncharacterized protein LOC135952542 [Calliphora vicina]|uniref:uncharacterized protein LOC135952542 n=1 Tax=Calliphora vicina TaxID=7373 RepID=UPI00325BAD39
MADETEESFHSTEQTTKIETEPENTKDAAPTELTPTPASSSPKPMTSFNEHEILAEQFENYLRIAQALMKTLKRPKDIEICTNLLRKVQRLNDSKHLEVKRNNNAFFRYCLKVLKWTSDNQPLELYQCWYRNKDTVEGPTESRTWLENNKSYMALKFLKDGTNIIYAAVADDPAAGWQDGGLNILAKRGACSRN